MNRARSPQADRDLAVAVAHADVLAGDRTAPVVVYSHDMYTHTCEIRAVWAGVSEFKVRRMLRASFCYLPVVLDCSTTV